MTPFEAYQSYLAIKQHFTTQKYDAIKFKWKVRATADSFNKRRDKFFFEKLAKHEDPKQFLLANFVSNENVWVREIAYTESAKRIYEDWQKKIQSLTYTIQNDLSKLDEEFDENFKVNDNQHPKLLKLYLGKDITLETVVVLVDLVGCLSMWNKKLANDPVWQNLSLKIRKYTPFLNYDKERIRKIILDKFTP
jgi:hypothetical protein